MFSKIKEWLFGPHTETAKAEAPYKVETPTPVVVDSTVAPVVVNAKPEPKKCGCGRSPTGLCVGLHALSADDWAVHKDNPNAAKPAAKKTRAPAKKAATAAMKAPPKATAPAKPRPKKTK